MTKIKKMVVGVGVLVLTAAFFLLRPDKFGLCILHTTPGGSFCSSPLGYPYGVALLPFSIAFLALSILGLATLLKTYRRWLKFSIGYFIVATLLLIVIENSSYGMGGISFGFGDVSGWAPLLAKVYAGLSVIVIGISELLGRRKRTGV